MTLVWFCCFAAAENKQPLHQTVLNGASTSGLLTKVLFQFITSTVYEYTQ